MEYNHNMKENNILQIIENAKKNIVDVNLFKKADYVRKKYYKNKVYLRGLIEFTNNCNKSCYYCGLQASNKNLTRYRLTTNEIINCCKYGYKIGFRSFVLQGGEDTYYTDEKMCEIIFKIKETFPDCALTLSIGEKTYKTYKKYFLAGADRYLLRHETANETHYSKIHPKNMSLKNRIKCLYNLKEIGFQVGAGFMVGSPYQTSENLLEDLKFLKILQPHMVGIGPFIPQNQTQFKNKPAGTLNLTLTMLALTRIFLPKVLLPCTTALGSLSSEGRKRGLKVGTNVIMPNLSPEEIRKFYSLYNNKISTGVETVEEIKKLKNIIIESGYKPSFIKGDHIDFEKNNTR